MGRMEAALRETQVDGRLNGEEVVRVIIVDNNQAVRKQLSRALARTSEFQVLKEMPVSKSAASDVLSLRPELVLLEVKTGDSLGMEICEEISRLAPEISVVVLTSYTNEEEREKVLELGAQAYLLKSVPSNWLTHEIKRLVLNKA